MICTAAAFPDEASAKRVRSALERRKYAPVRVYLCDKCDGYHFRGTAPDLRLPKKLGRILHLAALGFDAKTTAEMTGNSFYSVVRQRSYLCQWFGALNIPHLVATAIALGYLQPNDFIPPVVDKEYCERS